MKFVYLARDLWPVARETTRYYKKRRFTVQTEVQIAPKYGFRPTLLCRKSWDLIAVEVRSSPLIDGTLEDFFKTALAHNEGITIYLALPRERDGDEIALPATFLDKLREYGVGLFLVSSGRVEQKERGVRCSLRFSIPTGRRLAKYHGRVQQAVAKFNRGDPLDAIRDLTETVEEAIGDLGVKAASKRLIVPNAQDFQELSFETRIDLLSAPQWGSPSTPQTRFFDEYLKNDLKSFKGARILSHHPRKPHQQIALETQYMERMEASIRLLREIIRRIERCARRRTNP